MPAEREKRPNPVPFSISKWHIVIWLRCFPREEIFPQILFPSSSSRNKTWEGHCIQLGIAGMLERVATRAKHLEISQVMVTTRRNRFDVINVSIHKQFHVVCEVPDLIRLAEQPSASSASVLFALASA